MAAAPIFGVGWNVNGVGWRPQNTESISGRWEYKFCQMIDSDVFALNELANDGWEVISVTPVSGSNYTFRMFCKRRVK